MKLVLSLSHLLYSQYFLVDLSPEFQMSSNAPQVSATFTPLCGASWTPIPVGEARNIGHDPGWWSAVHGLCSRDPVTSRSAHKMWEIVADVSCEAVHRFAVNSGNRRGRHPRGIDGNPTVTGVVPGAMLEVVTGGSHRGGAAVAVNRTGSRHPEGVGHVRLGESTPFHRT